MNVYLWFPMDSLVGISHFLAEKDKGLWLKFHRSLNIVKGRMYALQKIWTKVKLINSVQYTSLASHSKGWEIKSWQISIARYVCVLRNEDCVSKSRITVSPKKVKKKYNRKMETKDFLVWFLQFVSSISSIINERKKSLTQQKIFLLLK